MIYLNIKIHDQDDTYFVFDITTETIIKLPDEVKEGWYKQIPLRRGGTPEDVARAMVYLAEAEFVTGQNLPVNGGFVL